MCSTLKALILLASLQSFSQRGHGGVHVLRVKGHACLHHQNAAVAHCVIHAVILAIECAFQETEILTPLKVKQARG